MIRTDSNKLYLEQKFSNVSINGLYNGVINLLVNLILFPCSTWLSLSTSWQTGDFFRSVENMIESSNMIKSELEVSNF